METPPIHVLLALDAQILGGEVGYGTSAPSSPVVSLTGHDDDDDEDWSPESPALGRAGPATVADEGEGTARTVSTASSRFWGVSWQQHRKKWQALYKDEDGKTRFVGCFDDEEEAARAVNKAIQDAGLEGKRRMNAVDATGALVPRMAHRSKPRSRAAVVAPDPAHDPSATTSKFWGVHWHKSARRWEAQYKDANSKARSIGLYDTQEEAAHAVNAAIRALPPHVQRRRKTNPVVDGQLVPRERKRRRREEPTATPSTRFDAEHGLDYRRAARTTWSELPALAAAPTRPA